MADEVDRWPQDLDGQGDPLALLNARQTSFTRSGSWKRLVVSTPTVKGASRIDYAYETGDQRVWVMPCPHCGEEIDCRFENLHGGERAPFDAHYMAQCCGSQIAAWQQRDMVLAGRWKATAPGVGRQPSYFLNSLSSLLTSWDTVWEEHLKANGDPIAEKSFTNLWLGESYEEHGAEVESARIAEHVEHYPRGIVPEGCGVTAFAVDVQDDRLEWALWGFGPAAGSSVIEQWLVDAGSIEGDLQTDGPWLELEALGQNTWPFGGGTRFPADALGLDTGGHHTQAAYKFLWRKRKWRGLKGSSSRDAVVLSSPKWIEVKGPFGRPVFRIPLYFVGTYDLKLWMSHTLKKLEGGGVEPGRLHLTGEVADEAYIDQLTAEVLVGRERRDGRVVKEWHKVRARNEALDLAVYARALAFGHSPIGLGVGNISREAWLALLGRRHEVPPSGLKMPEPAAIGQQGAAGAQSGPSWLEIDREWL